MLTHLLRRGLLATLLSLGLAASAAAQVYFAGQTPRASGGVSGPQADVDVIGTILYNSNVADSNAQIAAARGLKQQDVIFSPTVRLDLEHPIGQGEVFLTGTGGYNFYAVNTILDRVQLDFAGGAYTHFVGCREGWTGNAAIQQSDLNQQSLLVVKNTSYNESVTLAVNCGRPVGLAPGFSVSQRWTSNSDSFEQLNNDRVFAATASLAYQRPTLGSIGFYGEFDQITYDNRVFNFGGTTLTEGFDTYTAGARYTPRIGSRLTGALSLAYTNLQPTLPGGVNFSGLTYSVEADYVASSRISGHARFSRAVTPSPFLYANFEVNELEDAGLTYRFSPRIKASLDGSAETSTYYGRDLMPSIELTNQTIYSILGSVAIDLNRRISLTLILGGQQRDANQPGLSYSNLRAGLTAKAAF